MLLSKGTRARRISFRTGRARRRRKRARARAMDAPGVAPAPASPPPKRPAGSFPENHYSPGKLYTQFRIADGKSPLAWRKTKVFQADASPGSATGADATSPFAARAPVSRRLDTSGGVGADGERTPARLVQPSYEDKLFRANVPASRLLQRLQANKSLPLLMRKRARAVVQRRLLELVQPAEARCENELNALHAAATASRELPRDDDLPALEQKFAKEIAARAAFCLAKGAKAKVLKASGGARQPGASAASAKGSSSLKRKQPADKEAEQPPAVPVSGGVSKTSGRQIYLPARLREPPLADKQHGRRTPSSAAREAGVDGAALTGSVSTGLKGLKSGAVPRIKTAGFKPSKVRTRAGAHARGVARSPSARASYAGPWPCTVPPPPPFSLLHHPPLLSPPLPSPASFCCRTAQSWRTAAASLSHPAAPLSRPVATCATGTMYALAPPSKRSCPTAPSSTRTRSAQTLCSGCRLRPPRAHVRVAHSPARPTPTCDRPLTWTRSSSAWACASRARWRLQAGCRARSRTATARRSRMASAAAARPIQPRRRFAQRSTTATRRRLAASRRSAACNACSGTATTQSQLLPLSRRTTTP